MSGGNSFCSVTLKNHTKTISGIEGIPLFYVLILTREKGFFNNKIYIVTISNILFKIHAHYTLAMQTAHTST